MRYPPPGSAPAAVKLPTLLDDLRAVLRSLDWEHLRDDVRFEAAARLAIVGPVNSGKSTLFNLLGRNFQEAANDAASRLGVPVVPISAKKGTNVAEKLVPALIDGLPDLAVAPGREPPALRPSVAPRVV